VRDASQEWPSHHPLTGIDHGFFGYL
jgi:hypothetical protein